MERLSALSLYKKIPDVLRSRSNFLLSPPRHNPKLESPVDWAIKTWEYAFYQLENHRQECAYEPRNASLSEMPLCLSLDNYYSKLTDFLIVKGMLRIAVYFLSNPLKLDKANMFHTYAYNPKTHDVFDLTSAQAIRNESFIKPQDRINFLKEAVPDLITVLPNGLALLFGKRGDIYKRTGLAYEDEEFASWSH